jgi:hypothetical protein
MRKIIVVIACALSLSGCTTAAVGLSEFVERAKTVGATACEREDEIRLALQLAYSHLASASMDPDVRDTLMRSVAASLAALDFCSPEETES